MKYFYITNFATKTTLSAKINGIKGEIPRTFLLQD